MLTHTKKGIFISFSIQHDYTKKTRGEKPKKKYTYTANKVQTTFQQTLLQTLT